MSDLRERSLSHYAVARVARMYSVALPCLLLTFFLDSVGASLNAGFYEIQKVMWKPPSWEGYLSALFFVNEFQIFKFGGISPGSNAPYWSLSFEAAYYIVAGATIFCNRLIAAVVVIAVIAAAGWTIAVLLPCWWLGYVAYRYELFFNSKKLIGGLALLSLTVALAAPLLAKIFPKDNFGLHFLWGRGGFERNVLKDYLVAIPFAVHLMLARRFLEGAGWRFSPSLQILARRLGEYTFPLYLIHFPVLALFSSISPWPAGSPLQAIYLTLVVIFVVLAISPLCERLKNLIKGFLLMALDSRGGRR